MGYVPKAKLTEEQIADLNKKLRELKGGDTVRVIHFARGTYQETTGIFRKITRKAFYRHKRFK